MPVATGPGQPPGVQLAARPGADRALLALGARLEAAFPRPDFPYPIAGLPQ
jgi:Asp-tRNA(Asn)/Glu-tRNA(Gln) amidotransferase A subunit family amidase